MTEDQKKRMHPGAYKSCLIPYAEAIFSWWYDEQLPAAEIQRRLNQAGMVVSLSTITRFIKVRERLAAKRQKQCRKQLDRQQQLTSTTDKAWRYEKLFTRVVRWFQQHLYCRCCHCRRIDLYGRKVVDDMKFRDMVIVPDDFDTVIFGV